MPRVARLVDPEAAGDGASCSVSRARNARASEWTAFQAPAPPDRWIGYRRRPLPEWVRAPWRPGELWAATETAQAFHRSAAEVKAMVGGLGSSKTVTLIHEAIFASVANPGRVGLLFEPTIPLVRDVLVPGFEAWLPECGLVYGRDWTFHRSSMTWRLWGGAERGGATILGRSTVEWERIVGINAAWAGLDEPGRMPAEALSKASDRVRGQELRRIFLCGTPDPGSWFAAWCDVPPASAAIFRASSDENPWLSQSYLAGLEESYDARSLEAYRHGRTVVLTGTAYHAFGHENVRPCTYSPGGTVLLTCDNNRDPLAAVLCQVVGSELQCFAEVHLRGGSWTQLADAVHANLGGRAPATFMVHGDPVLRGHVSDEASSWGAYVSIGQQLRRVFPGVRVQFRAEKSAPTILERVETVNGMLRNVRGDRRIVVDPGCRELLADLRTNALTADGDIDKRDKRRTHWMDALGYLVCREWPRGRRAAAHRPMIAFGTLR